MTIHFHQRPGAGSRRNASSGFTLLELVAVIGIIAIVSLVVVGGFSGILKSMSVKGGEDAVRRMVNLARQQACVDGQDMYLWVTGTRTYALVRRGGIVASSDATSDRDYYYGPNLDRRIERAGRGRAKWIFDRYADLTEFQVQMPDLSLADATTLLQSFHGLAAFDMSEGVLANVVVPPQYDDGEDAWVFGVDKNAAANAFAPGAEYGWVTLPEQSLPGGYAIKDTYNDIGEFNAATAPRILFRPDGTSGGGVITIFEVDTGRGVELTVQSSGKISRAETTVQE